MPEVFLKPVTKDNWREVVALKLFPQQEKWVPTSTLSLAWAYIKPWNTTIDPFAIYVDNTVIGFWTLSYIPNSTHDYSLDGFLIDKDYQRKGYGTSALRKALALIQENYPSCKAIGLSVHEENKVARQLYEHSGFVDTGEVNQHGEAIYRYDFS